MASQTGKKFSDLVVAMQSSSDCSVRVVCRVRPLNEREKDTSSFVVNFPSENSVGVGVSLNVGL